MLWGEGDSTNPPPHGALVFDKSPTIPPPRPHQCDTSVQLGLGLKFKVRHFDYHQKHVAHRT